MALVNVQDFTRKLGAAVPGPVILFCPAKAPRAKEATYEPFLAEMAVTKIVDTFVDPGLRDLAYTAFYADEAKVSQILLEARTMPFLAERRVILVRNAERYNADSAAGALFDYIEKPNESTILMLVAAQIDKRLKFYRSCEKFGIVVECPALGEREVQAWAKMTVETAGKKIEPAAVSEIVRRAGTRLSDVNNAIRVVSSFVGTAPVIREEDVVSACADVAEEQVWALTDAIAASTPGRCIEALRNLFELGKVEDEILGTINWLLKTAYALSRSETSSTVSPFVANKIRPLTEKLGAQKLRDAFALCTDTHFMIRSTGVDGKLALELLVVKLAAPRNAPQSARA